MSHDPLKLFAKYSDGTISPEESKDLESLLSDDESSRREFLEYMNVCVALEDNAAYSPASDTDAGPQCPTDSDTRTKLISFAAYAIATAACAALAMLFLSPSFQSEQGIVTARVLRNDGASAQGGVEHLGIGDQVALRELNLKDGWLRLELPKGVVFDIYGPAKGSFETAEKFRLDSGRLNVDVGPHGKGFTVVTDNADIVDLGTQFGVELGDDNLAKVAVFSGEVEVHSKEYDAIPRLLAEGEGIQVGSTGYSSRLMSINISDEQAPQLNPSAERNHFEIRDNLTTGESLRYYGIVSNGMREGANVYTTQKRVRWKADTQGRFPDELVGADLVQTFHNDRMENDLKIELNVLQPSTVFVLFDERYEIPSWLSQSFIDTQETVRSGPWRPVGLVHDIIPDSQGEFYIHYKVWKKSVSSSNKLTLGESLNAYSRANQRAMYGIAIKPLNQAKREVAENQSRAAPN